MKRAQGLWMVGLLAASLLGGAAANVSAQDVQVPLDERGEVLVVDAALARRLALFPERPELVEARLFRTADGAFLLELLLERGGQRVRERRALDAADVAALRARIGARPADHGARQEGRYVLLAQSTLAGVAFYGWALPYVLGADDSTAAGLYLLTASASFFLPYALTEGQPVAFGPANLSRYGLTRGIVHGGLLYRALAGEDEPEVFCDEFGCHTLHHQGAFEDRAPVGASLLASVAEGAAGYVWARNERMSPGHANAIVLGGDLGLAWGLGATNLAAVSTNERAGAALALAGAAAGVAAGDWLAERRDYTWGDADVVYTGTAVGGYAGLAAAELLGADSRAQSLLGIAGSAAALWYTDRLVRDTEFSVGQSALNRLGAVAGALAGASVGVIAEDPDIALAGSALGAAFGYLATFSGLAREARAQQGEQPPAWKLSLRPEAVLLRGPGAAAAPAVPVLELHHRF